MTSSDRVSHDAIVIGGGHNGLVCAALLAKNGRKVLVLEASDEVGGPARTEEFFPGPNSVREIGCAAEAEIVEAKFADF